MKLPPWNGLTKSSYFQFFAPFMKLGVIPPFEALRDDEQLYDVILAVCRAHIKLGDYEARTKEGSPQTAATSSDVDLMLSGTITFLEKLNSTVATIKANYGSLEKIIQETGEAKTWIADQLVRNDEGKLVGVLFENTGVTLLTALIAVFSEETLNLWGKKVSYRSVRREQMLWKVFREGFQRVAIVGSPQLGKTAVLSFLYFLDTVISYVLSNGDVKKAPILTVPADTSIREETRTCMRAVFFQLKSVIFENATTGFKCSVGDYWEMLAQDGLLESALDNVVIIRSSRSLKEGGARDVWRDAIAKNYQPVSFIDEPHWGSGYDGVMDKMHRDIHVLEQSLKETTAELQKICCRKISIFTIGATCPEQAAINTDDVWKVIPMVVPPKYIGSGWYNGQQLPYLEGYVEQLPEVESLNEYARQIGSWTTDMEGPFRNSKYGSLTSEEREAEDLRVAAKVRTFVAISTKHRMDDPKGITVIRINNNSAAEQFIQIAGEEFPSVSCQRFYGNLGYQTIKRMLSKIDSAHTQTIVLLTARGRMANAFPNECTLFIDPSAGKRTTLTTIIQGLFGRGNGTGKEVSTLLVGDRIAEAVQILREEKFNLEKTSLRTGIPIHWRVEVADSTGVKVESGGRKSHNVRVFHEFDCTFFQEVAKSWKKHKITRGDPRPKGGLWDSRSNKLAQAARDFNRDLKEVIAQAGFFQSLYAKKNICVYEWGETVAHDEQQRQFDIACNLTEAEETLVGSCSIRWFDSREALENAEGGQEHRLSPSGLPSPVIGIYPVQKKCPDCNRDIQTTIASIRTNSTTTKSGYWSPKEDLCCWNHIEVEVGYIDLYSKRPLPKDQRHITGEPDPVTATRAKNSGWARKAHLNGKEEKISVDLIEHADGTFEKVA